MTPKASREARKERSLVIRHPRSRIAVGGMLLGCLLAVLMNRMGEVVTEAHPALTLRVVTFNLYHGGPLSGLTGNAQHLEDRLQMTEAEMARLHPDLIGLQEASWSRQRGNIAARLAGQLGLHYVYGPASSRFIGSRSIDEAVAFLMNFSEGPAILSRFPILDWQIDDLPRCHKLLDSRVLLSARVQTPLGVLRVFSAHTRGDACQTRRVADLVREQQSLLPSVLMGDFNAGPDSAAIAALTQGSGFVDAFRTANPSLPGLTVWQPVDAPTVMVRRRSDYIFLVPGRVGPGKVLASQVVLNTPRSLPSGSALWSSDHFGVLAEVSLPAPSTR